MTPTGNEHDILLASENWDVATCDSVISSNLAFIQGVAECLRAMDPGATNVADAAEIVSCANTRRDQARRDEELRGNAMKNNQERKESAFRDKFFFNHLDEEGWELYKSCSRDAERALERISVPTDTNIFKDPVSAS